ncbi:DUF4389 domain-containing protein [Candidatus Methylospira mobilis]|uniref:DUF4389 domain-containing protein n=1 Tax=Candidatus Methylospira mobilis TaxID=1808979 RepID=UPI0028F0C11C|nr:DUF4389 domain-containing protein [Candidatus Methylospira mobilis]WNV03974.1 DUF4389 domain-containing protein [Candidatus Methylospira mobilis]
MRNVYPPDNDDDENTVVTRNAFIRALFMAVFFALFMGARFFLWLIVLFQFLSHLFTGKPSQAGTRWGAGISAWIYAVMLFMTYNTERMPFPFSQISASRN